MITTNHACNIAVFFLIFNSTISYSQSGATASYNFINPENGLEYTVVGNDTTIVVDKMPQFPGGEQELISFLQKNIKYPKKAKKNRIEGTIIISFVVNEEGNLQDIKVIRGLNEEIDTAAINTVSKMPKWIPGSQKGKPVKVQYNLPLKYSIRE